MKRELKALLYVAIVLILLVVGTLVVILAMVASITTSSAQQLQCQCDAAIGPDRSIPATPGSCAPQTTATPQSHTSAPARIVWTDLEVDPPDRHVSPRLHACLNALQEAPPQLPPLQTVATGPAISCVGELIHRIREPSPRPAPQWNALANLNRELVFRAAERLTTGVCTLEPTSVIHGTGTCKGSSVTDPLPVRGKLVLPATLDRQARCGQRVDRSAISAGDLVYWRYVNHGATRTGIAAGPSSLLTLDQHGRFSIQPIPDADDLMIKRVLPTG
ncbi:hypothetical protein JK358_35660 [Nocardia sp. 2]|uniref:Uncharacterized protein n=1 Tax=Nocardia acididurans TaxID=2802282 RepID=A0ABS1MGF7_9NOCA|nr:hypothetical protein [Nocardia acididurans]MBL1079752.1 hypothetical protein [Nocardia acididurans]